MSTSPFSDSSAVGTADRGARSEFARARPGRARRGAGGELERMAVLDVGTGVGYLRRAAEDVDPVFWRFRGRGSAGEEDSGSNAGRRDGAGRLTPATDVEEGVRLADPLLFEVVVLRREDEPIEA